MENTSTDSSSGLATAPASQTLSRGIRILEILAEAGLPLPIDDIATGLGVHRSIAYRLVRTLEDHGLVVRDVAGRVALGPGMAALAAGVFPDLQAVALPVLRSAADDLGVSCFLTVFSRDECITLVSVEPRNSAVALAQRPGTRHPVTRGAPGRAILSQIPEAEWPADVPQHVRNDIRELDALGYATSHDEVIPTVASVAVPLALRGRQPAALAVVYVGTSHSADTIAARLTRSVAAIRQAIGG